LVKGEFFNFGLWSIPSKIDVNSINLLTMGERVEKPTVATEEKRAEVVVMRDDRKYQLLLPVDASIGEAYEAAFAILLRIIEIAKESAEKMRPRTADEPITVEVSDKK